MAKTKRVRRHNKRVYRSGLEETFMTELKDWGIDAQYEQEKLKYVVPSSSHTYTPDFRIANNCYIETKGIFSAQDRKKHLLIKEQHPNVNILIVFYRATSTLSKRSKTTYADWCDKNGIQWADHKNKEKIKLWLANATSSLNEIQKITSESLSP